MSVQFFVYLGFGLIIPILPEVVLEEDFATIHVGGLLTVYSLASFFTAPLWGKWSDKTGRKKMIIFGLIGFSVSFFLFALFMHNLPLLYVSRVIGGIFSGALYTAVTGFVADMTTDEERNKYMGLLGMSIGLGFIFGPAIGGILGDVSLQLPFIVSGTITFLLIFYASFVLKEPERHGEAKKREIVPTGGLKMWRYRIGFLFALSFAITFLLAGIESTFQLFQIDNIGITPLQVGYLFMASGLVDAAIQGGVVRKVKDGTETTWLYAAQIITAIGLILIPFSDNLLTAGIALSVFTAGNALGRTILVALTSKESGGRYGTAAGMAYSMDNMGRIIGPVLFAWLFTQAGGNIYYISSAIAIFSIIFIFLFARSTKTLRVRKEQS